MNDASTLKTKVAETRRQHILDAAARTFAERGFHRSTIHDVALAAGVSDGTIYNVFANKQALLIAMLTPLEHKGDLPPPRTESLDLLIHDMVDRRWRAFTPTVLPMLRVILSEVLVDRELRAMFLRQTIAPVLEGPLPLFQRMIDDGLLAATDPAAAARFVVSTFLGALLLRLLDDGDSDRDDAPDPALAGFLLNGLKPGRIQE